MSDVVYRRTMKWRKMLKIHSRAQLTTTRVFLSKFDKADSLFGTMLNRLCRFLSIPKSTKAFGYSNYREDKNLLSPLLRVRQYPSLQIHHVSQGRAHSICNTEV